MGMGKICICHKHYKDADTKETLVGSLRNALKLDNFVVTEPIIICCIGTDRAIGDAFGPMVGTMLEQHNLNNVEIHGTLESPMHALNLESRYIAIKQNHPDCFIIAIDACLGNDQTVNHLAINLGPVSPGKGVGKVLPNIGDISITCCVDTVDNADWFSVKSIRLAPVYTAAAILTNALAEVLGERREITHEGIDSRPRRKKTVRSTKRPGKRKPDHVDTRV